MIYRLLCFVLSLISWSVSVAQGLSPQITGQLQNHLDSFRIANNIQGISASVRIPNHGTWNGVSGNSHPGTPITPDMQFGIGSNTKLMTGVIVLKLVEQQLLKLEDSVGQYLGSLPNIHPGITVRQLLHHTSGLADVNEVVGYADSILTDPNRVFTTDEVLMWVGSPWFAPGTGWRYSNTNYLLAAKIAELATGQSYGDLLSQYILNPLQMDSTFLGGYAAPQGIVAHPWQNGQDKSATPRTALHSVAWASGAAYSNASEMTQWYHKLMSGNILNPQSMAELTTFVGSGNYGVGLIQAQEGGRTIWQHGGSIWGGYNSAMIYEPTTGFIVCVLVNQNPGQAYSLALSLLNTVWLSPLSNTSTGLTFHSPTLAYPNPGREIIHLSKPFTSAVMFDACGKWVLETSEPSISTEHLPPGVYTIMLQTETQSQIIPWIKY